jgi:hypothetical protein
MVAAVSSRPVSGKKRKYGMYELELDMQRRGNLVFRFSWEKMIWRGSATDPNDKTNLWYPISSDHPLLVVPVLDRTSDVVFSWFLREHFRELRAYLSKA